MKQHQQCSSPFIRGLIVVAVALLSNPANAARLYPIGEYPDENSDALYEWNVSEAFGLSADGGTVIAWSDSIFDSVRGGFIWTRENGMTEIAPLEDKYLQSFTPTSVSGDGTVVIGQVSKLVQDESEANGWRREWSPFRIVNNGEVEPLALPVGLNGVYATAVSDDARVILGYGRDDVGMVHAVRWLNNQPPEIVEVSVGIDSIPTAVSYDGGVMAGTTNFLGPGSGFVATSDGIVDWIPTLPDGYDFTIPMAVSADGSTVVGRTALNRGSEAFRWTAEGGISGLGLLPGGTSHSTAKDVSADGAIVVGDADGAQFTHEAFVWTQATGMQSIRNLLSTRNVSTEGWTFDSAIAISDDGKTILGNGTFQFRQMAWLVDLSTVPEPHAMSLLLVAASISFHRERFNQRRKS